MFILRVIGGEQEEALSVKTGMYLIQQIRVKSGGPTTSVPEFFCCSGCKIPRETYTGDHVKQPGISRLLTVILKLAT